MYTEKLEIIAGFVYYIYFVHLKVLALLEGLNVNKWH
jgi:hypothetical protein